MMLSLRIGVLGVIGMMSGMTLRLTLNMRKTRWTSVLFAVILQRYQCDSQHWHSVTTVGSQSDVEIKVAANLPIIHALRLKLSAFLLALHKVGTLSRS